MHEYGLLCEDLYTIYPFNPINSWQKHNRFGGLTTETQRIPSISALREIATDERIKTDHSAKIYPQFIRLIRGKIISVA